jgi:hypothetical protein
VKNTAGVMLVLQEAAQHPHWTAREGADGSHSCPTLALRLPHDARGG